MDKIEAIKYVAMNNFLTLKIRTKIEVATKIIESERY
jgi:hypothetical protein